MSNKTRQTNADRFAEHDEVLRVEDVTVTFPAGRRKVVQAVSGVSFSLLRGETLGIVGESGCGKTTLCRSLMQLEQPTSGRITLRGVDLQDLPKKQLRLARRKMQMIFQDPVSSLNPRRKVQDLVKEGLAIWGETIGPYTQGRVDDILSAVGLDPSEDGNRRPGEFSGGQCQRISIARALVMDPEVLICDEPVSALDVSVQAQILNLLETLKASFSLSLLFVSHDLAVVKNVTDRVLVMYLGKVCEVAPTNDLFAEPAHPYTRALLASIPGQQLGLPNASELISGELPSPTDPPSGCRFRTRCPSATELCASTEPPLIAVAQRRNARDCDAEHHNQGSSAVQEHLVACHYPIQAETQADREASAN